MTRQLSIAAVVLSMAACSGGGPSGPTPTDGGFLAGTWSGTLTVTRDGQPPVSGPTTWTFSPLNLGGGMSYRAQIHAQNAWLPLSTTATTDLVPPGAPPSEVSTLGDYASPRGCKGTFSSWGTVDQHTLSAAFIGVDCGATFEGSVRLSR